MVQIELHHELLLQHVLESTWNKGRVDCIKPCWKRTRAHISFTIQLFVPVWGKPITLQKGAKASRRAAKSIWSGKWLNLSHTLRELWARSENCWYLRALHKHISCNYLLLYRFAVRIPLRLIKNFAKDIANDNASHRMDKNQFICTLRPILSLPAGVQMLDHVCPSQWHRARLKTPDRQRVQEDSKGSCKQKRIWAGRISINRYQPLNKLTKA